MSTIKCPRCDRKLNYPDELAGKHGKCSNCGERVLLQADAALDKPSIVSEPIQNVHREPAAHAPRRWPMILLGLWAGTATVAVVALTVFATRLSERPEIDRKKLAEILHDNEVLGRGRIIQRNYIAKLNQELFEAKRTDARPEVEARVAFKGELVKYGIGDHEEVILAELASAPKPFGDNMVLFLAIVRASHGMAVERQLDVATVCAEHREELGGDDDRYNFAGLAGWRAAIDPDQEPAAVFASTLEMWRKFYQGRNRPPGEGCLRGIEVLVKSGTTLDDALKMAYQSMSNGHDPDDLYGWTKENWRLRRRPWESSTNEQPAIPQPVHEESTPNESDPSG